MLIKESGTGNTNQAIELTPIDVLNARYAKGENNQQEYDLRKSALRPVMVLPSLILPDNTSGFAGEDIRFRVGAMKPNILLTTTACLS